MSLFKSPNSVKYWYKHNDEAKLIAYFGGKAEYEKLGRKWDGFPLLRFNQAPDGGYIDYEQLKNRKNAVLPYIGFDPEAEVTLQTLKNIASAHGGKLISQTGDIDDSLEWENSDGERFTAKGTSVIAGHWFNPSYVRYCWDFDRLAKKDKIYADVWYDSHARDEDNFYYYDESFEAKYNKIKS